jgi:glycosyltransferase involved in cell wall biosynthesis
MGAFVHDRRLRNAVNFVLRALGHDNLEFIAFSDAERKNLNLLVGIPLERIHRIVYRGSLSEPLVASNTKREYVFTGGYSNRDYETFFAAAGRLDCEVVAVASKLNNLRGTPPNVELRLDTSWEEFEDLIGGCALLVLPLQEGGEACGQNVLFRGIRHRRPVVATRHDSLVDYLGDGYPGFVAAGDADGLRTAMERGLRDAAFRASLLERIDAASHWLREQDKVEDEIVSIVDR